MGRNIETRLLITGMLVAETPLHVGGFGESVDTDLPLAQNGKGEWYVPGTSIAGVLRGWCERNFREQNGETKRVISDLFGPKRERGKEEGHASFVLVEDTTIDLGGDVLAEIRDGVGIDRYYGTAADKAKFDRAVLPRGTSLAFAMTVEIGGNQEANVTKSVVRHLLEALTKSRVRFGAAKTRGLGRVKLKNCKVKEEQLNDFESIIKLLKNENGAQPLAGWLTDFDSTISEEERAKLKTLRTEQPQLSIEISWKPRLPVMVKAGYDGIGVDILPLTSGVGTGQLALVLPGSSIKGVLRSQAERIMRTLLDCKDLDPDLRTKGKPNFHDQIDSIPLVDELFGARNKFKDKNQSADATNQNGGSDSKSRVGLGALSIDDCYAKEPMNVEQWRKVEVARDDQPKEESQQQGASEVSYFKRELWRYLRAIDQQQETPPEDSYKEQTKKFSIEHHVAIDRWTGGASEGALYSVLAPAKVDWEPMRLTLDFSRMYEGEEGSPKLPALMLLLLTLRDVAEGRLPFGFATNRGMGEIEVTNLTFSGEGLEAIGFAQQKGNFAELKEELKKTLAAEAWKEWLNNLKN
jgi:CRISPR/Cas system CSM-associated protein Csm3 (group 7 of RAMP superfamily)